MIEILFQWTECRTDPLSYKPYSPTFTPTGVFISVEVPKSEVKKVEDGTIILTPCGMALAMKVLASAISGVQHGVSDDDGENWKDEEEEN
jgi:hypothetical protein